MPETPGEAETLDSLDADIFAIYNRQHYFVERHDAMAEKMLGILSLVAGVVSAVVAINADKTGQYFWIVFALLSVHLTLFFVALFILISSIRPLSTTAGNIKDETLVKTENKNWLRNSVIYYRGITSLIGESLTKHAIPTEYYRESVKNNFHGDLVQQIFILASYSEYKRKKLETATKLMIAAIVTGIIVVLAFCVTSHYAKCISPALVQPAL